MGLIVQSNVPITLDNAINQKKESGVHNQTPSHCTANNELLRPSIPS